MPTIKQLNEIWQAQYVMFGGPGEPKQSYDGSQDTQNFVTTMVTETPVIPQNRFRKSQGEIIGEIRYDEETDGLKIIPKLAR